MKNQKIGVIYLLIIRFVLTACAAPVSEEAATPTEISSPVSESTAPKAAVQPTMTEAASEPEPEIEEIPEVPAALSSACDHPYFPVLPDITWHYQTATTGLPTIEQFQTFNEITDESFILRQEIVSETTIIPMWSGSAARTACSTVHYHDQPARNADRVRV